MEHPPQEASTPEPHPRKHRHPERAEHLHWTLFLKPVLVYVFSLVSPALVIGIPVLVLGWSQHVLVSHSYLLATLGQALMDLPALVLFAALSCRGEWHARLPARIISIGIGATCAAVLAGLRFALTGRLVFMGGVLAFGQARTLPPPWNSVAATLAVLVYGPGEAIFVVYLVQAFDMAFGRKPRLCSWGVLLTVVLWALPHLANVFFLEWQWAVVSNVLVTAGIGLVMGVLFRGIGSHHAANRLGYNLPPPGFIKIEEQWITFVFSPKSLEDPAHRYFLTSKRGECSASGKLSQIVSVMFQWKRCALERWLTLPPLG